MKKCVAVYVDCTVGPYTGRLKNKHGGEPVSYIRLAQKCRVVVVQESLMWYVGYWM